MILIKLISKIFAISASLLVGLILFELLYPFFKIDYDGYDKWNRRFMLFSQSNGGTVFKNINQFFVYQENKLIKSTTYYYVNDNWVKEYSYNFRTNNLGLVQSNSIFPGVKSLVVLGDSFTEGQGSAPWFEEFKDSYKSSGLQLVNGGIFGTGFQSWKLLHDYLKTHNININKLVIIFISGDYPRAVWNMPEKTLRCIDDYRVCNGNEGFYGMPDNKETPAFLEKLKDLRTNNNKLKSDNYFKQTLKSLFSGTYFIYTFVKSTVDSSYAYNEDLKKNKKVIEELLNAYAENLLFIHIPIKEEIATKRIDDIGKLAINDINSMGGSVFNGLKRCGLTIGDYHENDGHPNEVGYKKISNCLRVAIHEKWAL